MSLVEERVEKPEKATDGAEEMYEFPFIGIKLPRSFMPWLVGTLLACLILGWSFLSRLPAIWFADDGYYSHGILIPFMTLAAIYMRREQLRAQPVGISYLGLVVLVLGLVGLVLSDRINAMSLSAGSFMVSLIGGAFFIFGRHIGALLFFPLLYLLFMMPVLGYFIEKFTNPLQMLATRVAVVMLSMIGYKPEIPANDPTRILLNNTDWQVGGPCSGFKLLLSLTAFSLFFVMISRLGWIRSLLLIFVVSPALGLFINGLRIVFIGVVGENWGREAGLSFHDYSGYIALLLCFFLLNYIVKWMEGSPNASESS